MYFSPLDAVAFYLYNMSGHGLGNYPVYKITNLGLCLLPKSGAYSTTIFFFF